MPSSLPWHGLLLLVSSLSACAAGGGGGAPSPPPPPRTPIVYQTVTTVAELLSAYAAASAYDVIVLANSGSPYKLTSQLVLDKRVTVQAETYGAVELVSAPTLTSPKPDGSGGGGNYPCSDLPRYPKTDSLITGGLSTSTLHASGYAVVVQAGKLIGVTLKQGRTCDVKDATPCGGALVVANTFAPTEYTEVEVRNVTVSGWTWGNCAGLVDIGTFSEKDVEVHAMTFRDNTIYHDNGLLLLYAGGAQMSKDFLTRDCVFENNIGTAFLAMPASTVYGIVMQNANIRNNVASRKMGAALINMGGPFYMQSGTIIANNRDSDGLLASFYSVENANYKLPAPPGYWVESRKCIVNRDACASQQSPADLQSCTNRRGICSVTQDVVGGDGNLVTSTIASPGTYEGVDYIAGMCDQANFIQTCNWRKVPSLLGVFLYAMPIGEVLRADFPNPCPAGILGSDDVTYQASIDCAGPCPAGNYCPTKATTIPLPCGRGSYCPNGTVTPLPCPAGTFGGSTGLQSAADCTACPEGHSCAIGASTPMPCGPGSFANGTNNVACSLCSTGWFQSENGQNSCLFCGAGNYSANVLSCLPCPVGLFCEEGATSGKECAQYLTGGTTTGTGAASVDDCSCKPGLFMKDDLPRRCVECNLPGIDCNEPGVSIEALPLKPKFWRSHNTSTVIGTCYTEGACVGSSVASVNLASNASLNASFSSSRRRLALFKPSATFGDGLCREGHRGAFCDVCKRWYYKGPGGLCQSCFANNASLGATVAIPIVVVLLVIAVGVLLIYRDRQKMIQRLGENVGEAMSDTVHNESDSKVAKTMVRVRILLSLIQVLSQIGPVFEIPFPPIYSSLMSWLGVIQLDLFTVMPIACFTPTSFHTTLLLRTLIPLFIMCGLAMCGRSCLRSKAVGKKGEIRRWMGNQILNSAFFILFLIYPSNATNIFATFQCKDLDDGSRVLMADLQINCKSNEHSLMTAYATVMLFVYPFGAPALYAFLLFGAHRKTLERLKDIESMRLKLAESAAAKDRYDRVTDSSKAEKARVEQQLLDLEDEGNTLNAQLPDFMRKLTSGYSKRVFFFEVVECFRKLAMVCMPVFFPIGSVSQLIFGLLVCFITFGAYSTFEPYQEKKNNQLALLAQGQIFFSLLSSIALKFDSLNVTSNQNMDVLLTILMVMPFSLFFILETPLGKLLYKEDRERWRSNAHTAKRILTTARFKVAKADGDKRVKV